MAGDLVRGTRVDTAVKMATEVRDAVRTTGELQINFGHRPLCNFLEQFIDLCEVEAEQAGASSGRPGFAKLAYLAAEDAILGWHSGQNFAVMDRIIKSHWTP